MNGTSIRTAALVLAASVAAAACGSGISTRSDYDPGAVEAIRNYQTYAWLPEPSQDRGRQLVAGRITAAVDAELAAKGYRKVARDPDFEVGWHVATDDRVDVQTFNDYYGYGYRGWGYGGPVYGQQTTVRNYTQGTLLLDVVDGDSDQLVWRGTAEGEVDVNASPEERSARINEAVGEILGDFPPGM